MCALRLNRDVGGFSELPYAVALLNTAIWVCYTASTPGRVAAFVTNSLAFILEVPISLFAFNSIHVRKISEDFEFVRVLLS